MKKYIYIGLFVFLGFLIQLFAHASLEIAYSLLLWREYDQWSFGLDYSQLWAIHNVLSYIFIVVGVWLGYRSGKFWWAYLYQNDGKLKPEFRKRWRL
jgi:uncharacterized BrkB/YihY/UPF0761 family membrane protein